MAEETKAAKVEAVQKRTFTRWVNYHISERKLKVNDLYTDLDDGRILIALLEILTTKPLPYKWTKDPKLKIHKLENLSMGLKYIQMQAIPLVNIDPTDIHDGKKVAILGLIFSLISRYSVGGGENDLLAWVNKQIQPYTHIDLATNFTTSWQDGRILSALVDSLKNGLIDTHNLKEPLSDTQKAMQLAEENFNIPQLLDASDMVSETPDEKANMTYIAQFREYIENEKKKRDEYKTKAPRANMCYAKGEGVEGGYRGRSLPFTIYSRTVNDEPVVGLYAEDFQVKVTDPTGADVPCSYKDNRDGTFDCAYTPSKAGPYKVAIDLKSSQSGIQPIRGSVYKLNVSEASDPSKSYAEGPGLVRVFDKEPGLFTVYAKDVHGKPVVGETINVSVTPKSPSGTKDTPVDVKDNGDGTYSVRYGPVAPGEYRINTQIGGKSIKDMPKDVICYEAVDPSSCIARGPGVTPGEPRVGIEAPFVVLIKDSKGQTIPIGGHDVKVSVSGPSGPIDVKVVDENKGIYKCAYTAPVPGDYVVDVKVSGQSIKDMPLKLHIKKPADPSKSYATGPGLEKAFDNRPAKFKVHAFDEDGKPVSGEPVEVRVAPVGSDGKDAGVPVEVKDNGDGTYDVAYNCDKPGDYLIHTNIRGRPIKDMPKKVHCFKGSDPTKTIVEGPGVTGGFAGKELPFTIRAIDKDGNPVPTGGDVYTVKLDGPGGPRDVPVKDNGDGTYSGSYVPKEPGNYKVNVSVEHDKRPVGKSPYNVLVKPGADPNQSFAVGAGWKEAWDALPAKFSVYAKDKDGNDVPGAEVTVVLKNVTSPSEKEQLAKDVAKMDPYIRKRKEDERKVLLAEQKKQREDQEAKAKSEGKDFKVNVAPGGDIPVEVRDNGDGTYLASYTPADPGKYELAVFVNGEHIKDSPKTIPVHLTKPRVVFWQHTYDAEKEELVNLKKRLEQAQNLLRSRGLA